MLSCRVYSEKDLDRSPCQAVESPSRLLFSGSILKFRTAVCISIMTVAGASTYKAASPLSLTQKPYFPCSFTPFDPEADINLAMQLIERPGYPWHPAAKIDLIAQNLSRGLICPQCIQDAVHGCGAGFLVIDQCKGCGDDDGDEDRESLEPDMRALQVR